MKAINKLFNSSYLTLLLISFLTLSFFFIAKPVHLQQNDDIELEFIETVLKYVNKFYVDKEKIDYKRILIDGINKLEIELDEVLVDFPDSEVANKFTVQVNNNRKEYTNINVGTTDNLLNVYRDVFSFVFSNLNNNEIDIRDIEYAVSDKILKTLDPHSAIITPDVYKEFLIETEGSFGGLGIVIGIRDGQLTVISPIEGTPAYKAGIKPNDKIVQIESESTINMTLIEAVGKLRGEKGSEVNIHVMRENFNKPKKFSIIRDTIKIESVEAFDFSNNILYLRIRDFQRNTLSSLKKEIVSRTYDIEGIILDLRGNPGGLLDQAEKVSDLFLRSGTVVTTKVGDSSKSYKARYKIPEFEGEVVVLVDAGSASASEIVAGALQNNDRALLLGQRTFGKGSVQQIFDLNDGSALKLTIANYFTPGDISIQDVGITPDIILSPSVITKDHIIYSPFENEKKTGNGKNLIKPEFNIKYLHELKNTEEEEEKPDEAFTKVERLEKLNKDFYIELAKNLIIDSRNIKRTKNLKEAEYTIENLSKQQEDVIKAKLNEFGIDWSNGESINSMLSVKSKPSTVEFKAGEEQTLEIKVKNNGINPVYRLRAITDSEYLIYKGKELIFGKLKPGEEKTWNLKFEIPKWVSTREDKVEVKFIDSSDKEVMNHNLIIKTRGNEKASYSHHYEIVDDGRSGSDGNGDNIFIENESVVLNVSIKNTGEGISEKTIVTLKNLTGDDIFLQDGRFEFENFKQGEIISAPFKFKVIKPINKIEFDLQILDEVYREIRVSKITLENPVNNLKFNKFSKLATVLGDNTRIFGSNFKESSVIAFIQKDSMIKAEGESGNRIKVITNDNIMGWISKDDLRLHTKKITVNINQSVNQVFNQPPLIHLSKIPLSTDKSEITINGFVEDEDHLKNISVYKIDDKIKLIKPSNQKIPFSFSINLDDGMNIFNIIAKDSKDNISKKTFTIRKES